MIFLPWFDRKRIFYQGEDDGYSTVRCGFCVLSIAIRELNQGGFAMKSHSYLCRVFGAFLALAAIVDLTTAAPTTADRAQKVVRGWLRANPRPLGTPLGQRITEVDIFLDANENALYYVVYLHPSGFIVVPADDLLEPIIAFADDGIFDPSLDNPLGALVSKDLKGRLVAARELQKTLSKASQVEIPTSRAKWNQLETLADEPEAKPLLMGLGSISDVRVAPLVHSKWGQADACCGWDCYYCYNYYTPDHYPCGCVATAMAQLIRYHEHPTTGVGTSCFDVYVDGIEQRKCLRGGNGYGGPYEWFKMVDEPGCDSTLTQRQAIGALCHDAAISSLTEFYSWGSGTIVEYAKDALSDTFMYTNAIYGWNLYDNIGAGLNGMMNPNLDAGLPVILGVMPAPHAPEVGHALLADGYGYDFSTLYHHLNMGWEAIDDAWYNLPDIDSSWMGPFDVIDECAYNILPSGQGEIISGRVTDGFGEPINGATVTAQGSGGPYVAVTNNKGIYAIVKVRSNSTYNVSVTKTGCNCTPPSKTVSTGESIDYNSTSGNKWGVDFVCDTANDDPQLTNGYVDPSSGDANTDFYWYVDYYDEDGDSPSTKRVYIDGLGYTMHLRWGVASNGTYQFGPKKLSAGVHDYYFYFTDGNGGTDRQPSGGEYTGPSVSAINPPAITGWEIGAIHGISVGELWCLVDDVNDGYVEPRTCGISRLRVSFDQAMDTSVTNPNVISIYGQINGTQPYPCSITWDGSNSMIITLCSALPDQDTYAITVSSNVKSAVGYALDGDRAICITALKGDVNSSREVNAQDMLAIRPHAGDSVDGTNARYDINCNGAINAQDMLAVRPSAGHTGPGCP